MKIERLKVANIKGIREIDITPAKDCHLVRICGKNGAGKTSAIDAIQMALGGKRKMDPKAVRDGERSGAIEVTVGDYVVSRTVEEGGETVLEVRTKDGGAIGRPQETLNKLMGPLSYDPLEFLRMDGAKQAETLRRLLGLDFEKMDQKRDALTADRRDIGRDLKAAKAKLDDFPLGLDAVPDKPVDVAGLTRKLQAAHEVNRQRKALEDRAETLRSDYQRVADELKRIETELAAAEKAASQAPAEEDTDAIGAEIEAAQEANEKVSLKLRKAETESDVKQYQSEWDRMTNELERIASEKRDIMAATEFPTPGLSLDPDTGLLLFNDVPFEQAAMNEKLRTSMAMGLKMNGEINIILMREASLLDPDSQAMVEEMAASCDAQIWAEIVGEEEGADRFIIREGRIKEASE